MTQQHVVDSPVRLGRCNRCQAYVWLGMASGVRAAADVGAATHPAWIAAVAGGRRTFRLAKRAGKPSRLLCEPLGGKPPAFTSEGAQDVTGGRDEVVVEHGCGAAARDMLTFTELEQAPAALTCDIWKASGWVPPPGKCARDRGQNVKSCNTCDKPPFDLAGMGLGAPESVPRPQARRAQPVRCDICDNLIDQSKPFFGIHHERWIYAAHEECP